MARKFGTRDLYKGGIISRVKYARQQADPRKTDLSPAVLDFGPVRFYLARHFGFCYGVENAIETAYKILEDNKGKRVFFLSEMIHNPKVNGDLVDRGVRFVFTPSGEQLVPFEELRENDIVVTPAFGTTLEMEEKLAERGIDLRTHNTTCPFVEKVWKRSARLGDEGYTVVIHGKVAHEETRATFSHSVRGAPTVVVLNIDEALVLAGIIRENLSTDTFSEHFTGKCSGDFDPANDLCRLGIVNQTTMQANETREIAKILRGALVDRYGEENISRHFADTSDTLCYATNENQDATRALIGRSADLALVVGGYNSSNTAHIVKLCEGALPTFFIEGEEDILSANEIKHYSVSEREITKTKDWLPRKRPLETILTCGASCPDSVLDAVLRRVLSFFENTRPVGDTLVRYPVSDVEK